MAILLLADHDNASISEQTAKALTAATQIGDDIHILVAGQNIGPAVEDAARLSGITRVLAAESAQFAHALAEPLADLVVSLAQDYDTIIAATTATGKNVLPRVAALLDVAQVSEITEVLAPDTFRRPIYAGNAIQTVQATDPLRVITVRSSAFPAVSKGAPVSAPVVSIHAPAVSSALSVFVSEALSGSDRPELTSAKNVVSGGRALGSADRFRDVIFPLADQLGAAIGASRAAVDAGYAPNDWQVGQTGKIVAPELYVAVGISGAIQHLAGMKDARIIIAINNDPDAPIFQIADYGLTADLFEALPQIMSQLNCGNSE